MQLGRFTRHFFLVAGVTATAGLAWLALRLRPRPSITPPAEPGRHTPQVRETRRIVPGPGLPSELRLGASNNNLDAVRHGDGFVYLAFRTAPHHFANPHTAIYVIRSRDEVTWQLQARFHLGTDLREPRLLSLGDRLLLYVSRLGKKALAFEPHGMSVAERSADGRWTDLEPMGPPGIMGWRVRRFGAQAVMLVYSGGETIYNLRKPALSVQLWKSHDGRAWRPFDAKHPIIDAGGGSEADCVLGDDGRLYGVIRNEAGDASGWGSKVCRAAADNLADWQCRSDRRKFDSPFMFWCDGEAYLIARRNLNGNGDYDLGRGPHWLLRTLWNQMNYSLSGKRTALWRYVQSEDRFAYITDLPSRGDCCFPAVIEADAADERVVYDYSCDINGPDLAWLQGQRGETFIYRHVLKFEERRAPA